MTQVTPDEQTNNGSNGSPLLDTAEKMLPMERDQLEELNRRAHEADRRARHFIRTNPLLTLGLAVAAGFMIGRLFTRR